MESRRLTMSNPSGVFSIVAYEALDHIAADADNDEALSHENRLQRSRRRVKVQENLLILMRL